jgi:arylsulfatase
MATRHREPGGLRSQFHHVTDVVPTILDVAGIEQPETVKGIPQKPLMPPATHTTQYFEILGNRALYHDGWIACFHGRLPWTRSHAVPFHATPEQWELYDVRNDFSQADDLAGSHPDTLAELGSMLDVEHRAYGVYPLSDVTTSRALPYNRPSYVDGVSTVTLFDDCVRLPEMATINVKNTSFHLKARPTVPADVEGVVIRPGGSMAGWSIYVHDGIPTYVYNWLGHELSFARATEPLPVGDVELGLRFRYDGGGVGKGGDAEVTVDGRPVGQCRVARTVPFVFSSPGRPLTSVAQRVRRSDRTSPTSPSRASCAGSRSPSIPS